jgi:hypothetical protein
MMHFARLINLGFEIATLFCVFKLAFTIVFEVQKAYAQ